MKPLPWIQQSGNPQHGPGVYRIVAAWAGNADSKLVCSGLVGCVTDIASAVDG